MGLVPLILFEPDDLDVFLVDNTLTGRVNRPLDTKKISPFSWPYLIRPEQTHLDGAECARRAVKGGYATLERTRLRLLVPHLFIGGLGYETLFLQPANILPVGLVFLVHMRIYRVSVSLRNAREDNLKRFHSDGLSLALPTHHSSE